MTGGSTGFGAVAADHVYAAGRPLLIGGRRAAKVGEFVSVDLASLESTRAFAAAAAERFPRGTIAALVLNAGLIRPDVSGRTADGFETTFAVNHLAHYLLVRLLAPTLADDAIIVLTTSGAHDPGTGAGLVPPRHATAELLAHPDRDPGRERRPAQAGRHAYTASKLCTVLTARELSRCALAREMRLTAIAFDPGQVFGTGLARELASPMRLVWRLLGTPAGAPVRWLSPTRNTEQAAGTALAELALGRVRTPAHDGYATLRRGELRWAEPSELARRHDVAASLWHQSARMVGLPGELGPATGSQHPPESGERRVLLLTGHGVPCRSHLYGRMGRGGGCGQCRREGYRPGLPTPHWNDERQRCPGGQGAPAPVPAPGQRRGNAQARRTRRI